MDVYGSVKDQLRGKRFSSNEELTGALFVAIEDIHKEEWKMCFNNWFTRMQKMYRL